MGKYAMSFVGIPLLLFHFLLLIFLVTSFSMSFSTNKSSSTCSKRILHGLVKFEHMLVAHPSYTWAMKCNSVGLFIEVGNSYFEYSPSISLVGVLDSLHNLSQDLVSLRLRFFNDRSIPPQISSFSKLQTLDLRDNSLNGSIPRELANLTELHQLHLSGNSLSGSIPRELANLPELHQLDLSSNSLSGSIPRELANLPELHQLDLSSNSLSGSIPRELANLTELHQLDLSRNSLSGSIPNELTNMTKLHELSLNDNCNLSGSIPESLWKLPLLEFLDLSSCSLSCLISTSLPTHATSKLKYIDISYNRHVIGNIPPNIGNFSNLESLRLSNNNISGSIPGSIGMCSKLTELSLGNNNLSGSIPNSIGMCSKLTELSLGNNNLSGSIPNSIGMCSKLTELSLGNNNLSGSIPNSIGMCSKLTELSLGNNNLSGSIPNSIGMCSKLTELSLGNNNLSGSIPNSIGMCSILTELSLDNNNLSGNIPPTLGNLNQLYYLSLHNNSFSGIIPSSLGNASRLHYVNFAHNNLIGDAPPTILNPNFMYLDLSSNVALKASELFLSLTKYPVMYVNLSFCSIDTIIPASFGNTTNLFHYSILSFASTKLKGTLPGRIFTMSWILLDLSDNDLHGPLPHPTNMIDDGDPRRFLFLSNNKFSGEIPNSFANMTNLRVLRLDNNNLSGPIPSNLGMISNLGSLSLEKNLLSGSVPLSLSNCSRLYLLDLGRNNLSSHLPFFLPNFTSLFYLNLQSNMFRGEIHEDLFKGLRNLQIIDLSDNLISGSIPSTLGQLHGMIYPGKSDIANAIKNYSIEFFLDIPTPFFDNEIPSSSSNMHLIWRGVIQDKFRGIGLSLMASLDLAGNNLIGIIPKELGNLHGLVSLNLSRNALSGEIPKSMANMTQLESLDLSWNNLSGHIPPSFVQLTFLEVFNVSYNVELSGRIPLENQFSTFDNSSYFGDTALCGDRILPKCGLSKIAPNGDGRHEAKVGWQWEDFWSGLAVGYPFGLVLGYLVIAWLYFKRRQWLMACLGF